MTSRRAAPPEDGSGEPVVRFGSVALPGYSTVLGTAINELATSEFSVRLDDAGSEPIDYVAGIEIEIGGEHAFDGTVLDAFPRQGEVHVHCASGVSLREGQMGVMAAEQFPDVDLVYAAARSAGFSAKNTNIEGLDKLPLEPVEVVVALHGVEVPGRRTLGVVSLLPPRLGQVALEAFDLDRAPPRLVEAFKQADCFAVVIRTASRLWDAEQSALDDLEVALGWLAVRARYGLARLPGGEPQRYKRDNTRTLPRRGTAMAVKGLSTGRRWIRDPETLTARPRLMLSDVGGQLWPDFPTRIAPLDRLALLMARRAFEGELLQRVVALWETWELYAGAVVLAPAFSAQELERLQGELPGWLSEAQRQRLHDLFALANNHPLSRRMREALEHDGVQIGEGEWTALWKLRPLRNRAVHGASTDEVVERELELACSLLCRALVYRLGRKLEPAI